MIARVRLFAAARQLAGAEQVEIELADGASVADLRRMLAMSHPALAPLLPQTLFAIDTEYVRDSTVIRAGADIACIPPVSGG